MGQFQHQYAPSQVQSIPLRSSFATKRSHQYDHHSFRRDYRDGRGFHCVRGVRDGRVCSVGLDGLSIVPCSALCLSGNCLLRACRGHSRSEVFSVRDHD